MWPYSFILPYNSVLPACQLHLTNKGRCMMSPCTQNSIISFCLCLSFCVYVRVSVGDAAVGKSALSHIFHSDGSLFQKNYSMVRASPGKE